MRRRAEPSSLSGGAQLALFPGEREPVGRRKRYVHRHTPEELAAFDRTNATILAIRPDWLADGERLCPGECGKVIRGKLGTVAALVRRDPAPAGLVVPAGCDGR
jgi:hypothetical protein